MASNQKFNCTMLGIDGSITRFVDIPAASESHRDSFAKVYGGEDEGDAIYACMKADDGNYHWENIVLGNLLIQAGVGNPDGTVNGFFGQQYHDTNADIIYVCISNPTGTVWRTV